MAVVIASDLGKDIAGEPLLRGISFKLERRDRMTLSGRNGAGKTTLLRMLSGEASVDSGELVFSQGRQGRAARPAPAARPGPVACATTCVEGAPELVAIEAELAGAGAAMADGDYDEATLRSLLPTPRPGSSTPAATTGASGRCRPCTASASATTPTSTARWTPSPAAS